MRKHTVRSRKLAQSYVEAFVVTLLIGLALRICVITPYKIPSNAMSPALMAGDYVFAFKLPYGIRIPTFGFFGKKNWQKFGKVKKVSRGDIVLFSYKEDPDTKFIRRVVGLPGDKIEVTGAQPIIVPQDNVYLSGDNKDSSDDSHVLGLVPFQNIDGKAIVVWFSIDPETSQIRWDRIFNQHL